MTSWGEGAFDAYLPADMVLGQADIGVVVADRLCNLLYLNEYAARLFRVSGDMSRLAGGPVLSLGLFAHDDLRKMEDLAAKVLRGRWWEDTFSSARTDGSHALLRGFAVPLRHAGGDIDGMMILVREASKRDGQGRQDMLALLERVGERLAGSLELGTTLKHVAEMLVPQFADHCFIDLFAGDQLVRRVQRHANDWMPPPGTWAQTGQQIHYPEGHFCQQAMARLETIAVADLETEDYPAPSAESMAAAREAGLTSVVAAPLYARGELLGVMSLALSRLTDRDERSYDTLDRDLVSAIASRVAIAIDNAMLFETERQTALAFQKSLLPQAIPELDGLEVACRYVPAKPLETQGQGIQTQVGGDWYDIIPLAAGRVGIVIGDVEGRGARAAAIMGQLRAALRAFAQDEKAPADIMRKLDDWCRSLAPAGDDGTPLGGDPPTASCIYMIYDAWSRELTFANAGHDAPLLISGGQASQLEFLYKGVLLGVRGKGISGLPTYKEETIRVPPGAILVFYTDGLTDRRARADGSGQYSETEAVEMLEQAVRAAAASGDADAVATAAEFAVPGDIDDDMAILVVRSAPTELASTEKVFPAEPIMVSEARRLTAATFRSWGMDPEQIALGCLLVSEVVTNAVLHASVTPSPGEDLDFDLDPVIMPAPVGAARARDPSPFGSPRRPASAVGGIGSGRAPGEGTVASRAGTVPVQGPPWSPRTQRPAREFALRLRRGANAVWVEVFDADLRLPRIRTAGETDEGGRGLYLVEQLATRWGSRPTPEGKAVWFEMPRSVGRPLPGGGWRPLVALALGEEHEHHQGQDEDGPHPALARDGQLHLAAQARPPERDEGADEYQQDDPGHRGLLNPPSCEPIPRVWHSVARWVQGTVRTLLIPETETMMPQTDAFIVGAVRTPIGKRNGGLAGVHPVDLAAHALRALVDRTGVDPAAVEDVIMGCVSQIGPQTLDIARNAWLSAGLPESVPGVTVDRQCGSSQQAVHFAAQAVMSGTQDLVVAAGVESMSVVTMGSSVVLPLKAGMPGPHGEGWKERYGEQEISQFRGAQMICEQWGFKRRQLEEFSLESHERAVRAIDEGRFEREIAPLAGVSQDEGPRRDTSLEKMAGLAPLREGWEVTAAAASQISDGAAALLIASQAAVDRYGLVPRARVHALAVVGADPVIMLTGPIPATKAVLGRAGMKVGDIDVFEVNEAFAPVLLAWSEETGASLDLANPNGGAIALGHPLGATGAILMTKLVHELERTGGRFGLQTMCEGGGQANATIIERV